MTSAMSFNLVVSFQAPNGDGSFTGVNYELKCVLRLVRRILRRLFS